MTTQPITLILDEVNKTLKELGIDIVDMPLDPRIEPCVLNAHKDIDMTYLLKLLIDCVKLTIKTYGQFEPYTKCHTQVTESGDFYQTSMQLMRRSASL